MVAHELQTAADVSESPGVEIAGIESTAQEDQLVDADLLVEDVSIDGMCGVY